MREKILWWAVKRRVAKDRPVIIAVGGAIAKTSTKMAIGTLLKLQYPGQVRVGFGNLNSYLGVPLAALGFEIDFYTKPIRLGWVVILWKTIWRGLFKRLPEYLVLEYGTDKPGDIEAITEQLPPDVGVITVVGPAHLANYPSVEAMVKDEGYLAERTKERGFILVNSSDQYLTDHHRRAKARVVNVVTALEEISIKFMEALAREFDIGQEVVEDAKANLNRPERRFQEEVVGPYQLLDDSYNSSPLAVKAAVHLLAKMPKPRVAILGAMRELGSTSDALHQETGSYVRKFVDKIISIGDDAKGFGADVTYPDSQTAAKEIFSELPEGGSILVKGSKSVHTELISQAIRAKYTPINNESR